MAAVVLVPVSLEHAEAMARWMLDPEVRENVGLQAEPTIESTRAWIARAVADVGGTAARAVLLGERHVGNVVLDRLDRVADKVRLHVYIGERDARGRGVGRAAILAALRVAFDELGVGKVYLTVHAKNARAIAAYEAVGFVKEGVHRDEFVLRGERIDEIYMGILARELPRS